MGRVNYVGPGYGNTPKGYFVTLSDTGRCELVLIRGEQPTTEGDAEQQAYRKAHPEAQGGEKSLGVAQVPNVGPKQWHNLKLRFEGSVITAFVDGTQVLTTSDGTYAQGMAGLRAGSGKKELFRQSDYQYGEWADAGGVEGDAGASGDVFALDRTRARRTYPLNCRWLSPFSILSSSLPSSTGSNHFRNTT